jgi:pyruvate kinase
MRAITTIPPYAPYLKKIAEHPIVEGFRLNTVMPVDEPLEDLLTRLEEVSNQKTLWIDLKCRQLRIKRGTFYDTPKKPVVFRVWGRKVVLDPSNPKNKGNLETPPWAIIELDHEIELDTSKPVKCYMNDGIQTAYIARVKGNRLLMLDGPKKVVGGGESMNILHPSLKIKGYLTENDKKYIEAAKKVGMHKYMASYVEEAGDLERILELDPAAEITAKIESQKGLEFVSKDYSQYAGKVRLMAARGDLYVEVGRPHKILNAVKDIIEADKNAIAASRIMPSLGKGYSPACQDISDVGYLMEIGYKHLMVGDDICFDEDSLFSALNILYEINESYKGRVVGNKYAFNGVKGGEEK